MNISIILAHPDSDSFNHAIAQTACRQLQLKPSSGQFSRPLCRTIRSALLQKEEIPSDRPLTDNIRLHCNEIAAAEGIIIIHPKWWGQPPANIEKSDKMC